MPRTTDASRRIDVEALKRDRPLTDVVAAHGIALRREGTGTYRALCPFHEERTPSFWIDARGDVVEHHYYCFGCANHGDVVTFVMAREGCTFREACERLANGSRPPVVEPAQRTSHKSPVLQWEHLALDSVEAYVLDLAMQYYESNLWRDARVQAYVRRRGIPAQLAQTQRLGYASGRGLFSWLGRRGQTGADLVSVAVRLGLMLERPRAEDERPVYREFFFDRLIVPELRQRRPVWCIGRTVEDEQPAAADQPDDAPIDGVVSVPGAGTSVASPNRARPKYLALRGEKPIMGLERVLGHRAAFIVEGPFDLLAGIGWDLPVFAICGTHVPVERLSALADALAIYGVFDPDRAGLAPPSGSHRSSAADGGPSGCQTDLIWRRLPPWAHRAARCLRFWSAAHAPRHGSARRLRSTCMKTEIFASVQPNQRPPLDTRAPAEHVLEIVTPRTNVARLSSAEHLFGALVAQSQQRPEPVSLEIVGDSERRRFLVRTPTGHGLGRVAEQLGASYPQAVLRGFQSTSFPRGDPLQVGPDEQVVAARLKPRQGEHLPLRTFEDRELEVRGDSFQVDPLLGILSALSDLPAGWRAVCQLIVLANAPQDWARAHQRLALERPLERERHIDTGPSPVGPLAVLALIGIVLVALSVTDTWSRGDWLPGLELASGVLAATVLCVLILRWLGKHDLVEPRLVQQKLSRDACLVELRLAVIAPLFADSDALDDRLRRLVAAYRPFALATGNSLIARTLADENDLRTLASSSRPSLLNVRELAGLWHLPQSGDDIAFVERTTARRRLPLAHTVAPTADGSGCHIGVSAHQNHTVPVYLPTQLLRRHLLAVAKTRRGKSSLLLQMVHHLMQAEDDRRSVVLVDPHRDLAVFALGLVPRAREADVVYLDVSNRRRPFGINLLDTGLGWDRDQASVNVLRIFRREFDGYWGPRMEDAFRFATLALYEANEALCADDPLRGRGAQHTILDVPALLERPGFRRQVLKKTSDPFIRQWFDGYFEPLDRRYQLEIINPVQTKVHKYLGSRVARHIVGQPRSTIDFRELVGTGKIIIINLNAFDVGEDLAALIGGSLFNLAARAVSSQALSAAADRRPVTLVVDEFHTLPGADYEQVLGELAKYGANVMLASQTLSRLDRLTDAQRTRNLRASVFSNLDGLFAFHTSAEDAAYLAEELGGGLDAQDLLELGHFQWCAA